MKKKIKLIGYHLIRFSWILLIPFAKPLLPKKVIFLIGNQGDGISFISRVLRRNKDIVTITGNHKYWTGADEIASVMEIYLREELKSPGYFSKEFINKNLTGPRSWSYGSNEIIEKYYRDDKDFSKKIKNNLLKSIDTSLIRFGRNKIFLDKSQVFSLKMKLLDKIFSKKVFFIHVTRNPYVSICRASLFKKAGDLKRYSKFLSDDKLFNIAIEHFKNTTEIILNDCKKVKNYKRLKFEDFLENPEKHTKELCKYLKISYSKDMIPNKYQKIPFFTKFNDRWFPINKNVNTQYLTKIPKKQLKLLIKELIK